MNSGRALFWHQGLFLQPHHFQRQDGHFHALLAAAHRFLHPYFWGAASAEIQASALSNRLLCLLQGEFVFQDHTHAVYPGNALIEPRAFDKAWPEGERFFDVYLGLRRLNENAENVTVVPRLENLEAVSTRFVTAAEPEELADLHQEGPPARIQRMHLLLKLFWPSEIDALGDWEILPLARLERSGEEIGLSASYVPPSLGLSASRTLAGVFREIRDQIGSRGHQLEAYKRDRGIHTAEFGARDMVYLLALRSLNRYIPLFQHFSETGGVHPWQAYGLIRQLIGELSSFSIDVGVLGTEAEGAELLPSYDHRNLGECFHLALNLVTRLLDEITAGPDYVIPLVFDGTYLTAEMPPAVFEGRNRFYLVCQSESDAGWIVKSLETIAKMASRETLPILIARALPGVRIHHLPTPPQELPRRSRSLYFQVDHQSDHWVRVQKGHNLALFWDSAPEDLKAELMVVGRS
jgi:type VI secretion system protein ImpJ